MIKKIFFIIFFILVGLLFKSANAEAIASFVVASARQGGGLQIKILDLEGRLQKSFFVLQDFVFGANVACGDVDGDQKQEIVIAPRLGGSQIQIFSDDGKAKYPSFNAFGKIFYGGMDVALGDLDSDGKDEIIVGAGNGGSSQIKIFDFLGKEKSSFFAISKNFHNRITLAVEDVDRDGKREIIVGTGEGGRSLVRIFKSNGKSEIIQYLPFPADFRGGVEVAAGDIDGDGKGEIGVCQATLGARCKIYRYNENKFIVSEWSAYAYPLGVKIFMADINYDGKAEIITFASNGKLPIRVFQGDGKVFPINLMYDQNFLGGWRDMAIIFDFKKNFARVTYIDDGDTIYLNDGRDIRYIGIDTPEIGEPYYTEATNRNKELVFGKEVLIEYDQQKIDPYGRLLAYVFVNDDLVNLKLVEEGYARAKIFFPDKKYSQLLQEAEKKAQARKIGIWQDNLKNKNFQHSMFGFLKIFL